MSMAVFFFVPTIIFMALVAPIWLLLHYRSKTRAFKGLDSEEQQALEHLLMQADKLSERVKTLEQILDDQSPNWRAQDEPEQHHSETQKQ